MNTVFFFIYQNLDLTENIALINLNFSMIQYLLKERYLLFHYNEKKIIFNSN